MTELSSEAVVAGQAAAAAVEELHDREELADAAATAAVEASVAAVDAEIAVEEAAVAQQEAEAAASLSVGAAVAAEEAQETAEVAGDLAMRTYEELRAARAEMGEIRSLLISQQEQEVREEVAEVPVNATAANEQQAGNSSGSTESHSSTSGGQGTSVATGSNSGSERRTGLRRGRRG